MISVLSLIVAGLAVFFGPAISWAIARRQLRASTEIAMKQIVAPMRQAWTTNLRELLADLASSSLHYHVAGFEDRSDAEYRQLTLIQHKIILMLDPTNEDHMSLEDVMAKMVALIGGRAETDLEFQVIHEQFIELSRTVLDREWKRTKSGISIAKHKAMPRFGE